MKQGTEVILTKVETVNKETNYSPGYWTQGFLIFDVKIGEGIYLGRYKRANPDNNNEAVNIYGIFRTSPIVKVEGNLIYTKNSIWKIEEIKQNDK